MSEPIEIVNADRPDDSAVPRWPGGLLVRADHQEEFDPLAPHSRRDPATGNCEDCGATREEMADRLAPTCEKAEGPHRLLIIEGRRQLRHMAAAIRRTDDAIRNYERDLVTFRWRLYEERAREAELRASLDVLRAACNEPETLSVGQAIARLP